MTLELHPSAQFSATLRVRLDNRPGAFAQLAAAVGAAGDRQVELCDRLVGEPPGALAPGWGDQRHAASARRIDDAGSTAPSRRSISLSGRTPSASAS